jgi:hypothetical protein
MTAMTGEYRSRRAWLTWGLPGALVLGLMIAGGAAATKRARSLRSANFDWSQIDEVRGGVAGGPPSYLTSLLPVDGNERTSDATVFRLAGKDFHGQLLLQDFSGGLRGGKVHLFLDYRPIAVIALDVAKDDRGIYDIDVPLGPADAFDLSFVVDTAAVPTVDRLPGRQYPLVPRDINVFHLVRHTGPDAPLPAAHPVSTPKRTAPARCDDAKLRLMARDQAVAVVNCGDDERAGVFFGDVQPVPYRVPPRTVAVFDVGAFTMLLHAPAPWPSGPAGTRPDETSLLAGL